MEKEKLDEILRKHYKWLTGNEDGKRADLRDADLMHAKLVYANLTGVDLMHANLTGAILRNANFEDVILSDKTEGLTPKILDKYFPISCPEYGEFIGWKKHVAP